MASGRETLADLWPAVQFYEQVRVFMAKLDAAERQAAGEPVPEEVQRLLSDLVATSTMTGRVLDIYEAAGMAKPSLSDLSPTFQLQAQEPRTLISPSRRCATCSPRSPPPSRATTWFGSAPSRSGSRS